MTAPNPQPQAVWQARVQSMWLAGQPRQQMLFRHRLVAADQILLRAASSATRAFLRDARETMHKHRTRLGLAPEALVLPLTTPIFPEELQSRINETRQIGRDFAQRMDLREQLLFEITRIRCVGLALGRHAQVMNALDYPPLSNFLTVFPLSQSVWNRLHAIATDSEVPGAVPLIDPRDTAFDTLRRIASGLSQEADYHTALDALAIESFPVAGPDDDGLLTVEDWMTIDDGVQAMTAMRKEFWESALTLQRRRCTIDMLLQAGPEVSGRLDGLQPRQVSTLVDRIGALLQAETLHDRCFGRADAILVTRAQALSVEEIDLTPADVANSATLDLRL